MMPVEEYPALLACFRSGRMTDADLLARMQADDLFRIYILEALKRPHEEPAE